MGLDDLVKGNLVAGLAVGLVSVLLAPTVLPAVARAARPLAKAAVKGGIIAYEKGRELLAEAGEAVEDIAAEARSEMRQPGNGHAQEQAQGTSTPIGAPSGEHASR